MSTATPHSYLPAAVETSMPNLQELEQLEAYWHLRGHRKPVLLIQEMIKEYEPFLWRIRPNVAALVKAFRKAKFPIFWSTWWRFSPQLLKRMHMPKSWARNHTNELDRLFGPFGMKEGENGNFLYSTKGWEELPEIAPSTAEEKKRVQKKWRMDCFAESDWVVPAEQGSLAQEFRKLGVDLVINIGVWTDACIVATAFGGMNADFDVVTVEDAVDTVTTGHQAALNVIQGAAGKLSSTQDVLRFLQKQEANKSASEPFAIAALFEPSRHILGPQSQDSFLNFEERFTSSFVWAFAVTWTMFCGLAGYVVGDKRLLTRRRYSSLSSGVPLIDDP